MSNGRFQQLASKRVTAWSKQSMPGWWNMLLALLGAGFFVYIAHAMIAGPTAPQYLPPVVSATATPTTGSVSASPAATAPASTTTSPSPAQGGVVHVAKADGSGQAEVPAPAAALAKLSFEALFSPSAAAQVPTVDGGHHQPPAATLPGVVSNLALVDATTGRFQFSAVVDVDGPRGPLAPVSTFVTVAYTSGGWAFVNTAG